MGLLSILTLLVLVSSSLLQAKYAFRRGYKFPLDEHDALLTNGQPDYEDDNPLDNSFNNENEIFNPIKIQDELPKPIMGVDSFFNPIRNKEEFLNSIRNLDHVFSQIEDENQSLEEIPTQKRKAENEELFEKHFMEWCKILFSLDCTPHLKTFTNSLATIKHKEKTPYTQRNCELCTRDIRDVGTHSSELKCNSSMPTMVTCFITNQCNNVTELITTVPKNSMNLTCYHCNAAILTMVRDSDHHGKAHLDCKNLFLSS